MFKIDFDGFVDSEGDLVDAEDYSGYGFQGNFFRVNPPDGFASEEAAEDWIEEYGQSPDVPPGVEVRWRITPPHPEDSFFFSVVREDDDGNPEVIGFFSFEALAEEWVREEGHHLEGDLFICGLSERADSAERTADIVDWAEEHLREGLDPARYVQALCDENEGGYWLSIEIPSRDSRCGKPVARSFRNPSWSPA